MENCPEKSGRYTESELRDRGIGKFLEAGSTPFRTKKETYRFEGVYSAWMTLKRSLIVLCTDADGHRYSEQGIRLSQIIMDKFLIQRCRGEAVPIPGPVISETSLQPGAKSVAVEDEFLKAVAVKSDFENWDGKIDTISDLNWIYNNLTISDVTAADAPSPGAWAHLLYHRSSKGAMDDFFTKVYPRLIPAKGTIQKLADKLHDDGRTTFDLLDRLLAECVGSTEQVPVLPVVLPERTGLQDEAGQSPVPQKSPRVIS